MENRDEWRGTWEVAPLCGVAYWLVPGTRKNEGLGRTRDEEGRGTRKDEELGTGRWPVVHHDSASWCWRRGQNGALPRSPSLVLPRPKYAPVRHPGQRRHVPRASSLVAVFHVPSPPSRSSPAATTLRSFLVIHDATRDEERRKDSGTVPSSLVKSDERG